MAEIISIGYEKRSIDEFVTLLLQYSVEKLVDIRELPLSRKRGFSKKALSECLAAAGIEYIHIKAAGNPHRKESGNTDLCLSLYRKHLDENPIVLDIVAAQLRDQPTAILCYERDHAYCHRSVLLERLEQGGVVTEVVRVE